MPAIIRLAVEADRPVVEEVVHAAYSGYVSRLGQTPGPMLDDYGRLIAGDRVYVLEDEGQILGALVLIPEDDVMLLDNVAVRPHAQGKGHGRRLLKFAEATALEAGYREIRLYTHEKMTENIALYARIGFRETHRAVQRGLPRVFMTKKLR